MVHCLEGTACTPHAEKSWHSPLRKCQIPAQCRSTIVLAVKDCKEKAMSLVQQDPQLSPCRHSHYLVQIHASKRSSINYLNIPLLLKEFSQEKLSTPQTYEYLDQFQEIKQLCIPEVIWPLSAHPKPSSVGSRPTKNWQGLDLQINSNSSVCNMGKYRHFTYLAPSLEKCQILVCSVPHTSAHL